MRSFEELPLDQTSVVYRAALDVGLAEREGELVVLESYRIRAILPTLEVLRRRAKKIFIISYLGRPAGQVVEALRLKPVAAKLKELLSIESELVVKNDPLPSSYHLDDQIVLLENSRFWPGEDRNDIELAKKLAELGDFFVTDAFAQSHRTVASIVRLPELMPAAAGYLFLKESEMLTKLLNRPKRPFIVIIGGAKVADKVPVIESLEEMADRILIGGAAANEVIKRSLFLNDRKVIIARDGPGQTGRPLDIGGRALSRFEEIIKNAETVFWSGPLGVYENPRYRLGTQKIAEAVVNSGSFSVIGGGDTITALDQFGLLEKMSFVSTGGGATLEFLAGQALPGLLALEENERLFK